MAGNLLNIGKTGLYAAQAGLATTGHNIANANVPGYSRQRSTRPPPPRRTSAMDSSAAAPRWPKSCAIPTNFLNNQVRNAQATTSALNSYNAQISQVDNMLADPTTGLSPALQDFFKAVQDTSANAGSTPSRQNLLSSAESLAARFQGMSGAPRRDRHRRQQPRSSRNVTLINSYASQIADLNQKISGLANSTGHPPNDLMDTRDQLVLDLNKQIKATVVPGDNHSITVSIGNGQPLVVGSKSFELAVTTVADRRVAPRSRLRHRHQGDAAGRFGADRRRTGRPDGIPATTLDAAQNALGRVAIGLAATFNAQHRLGQDSAGNMGGDLFFQATPAVSANQNKNPADPLQPTTLTATMTTPAS